MSPEAEKVLKFIDTQIGEHERIMLEGTLPAEDGDAGWANYRAAVMRRRDLYRLRGQTIEVYKRENEDDEDEAIQEGKTV